MGFAIIEERQPSFLLDRAVLITGEIDRSTAFETGFQGHEAWRDGGWRSDPLILDDQALIVSLGDRGLVILSGCGHAGIVNTVRYARELTGNDAVAVIIGGFHSAVRCSSGSSTLRSTHSPSSHHRFWYRPSAQDGEPCINSPPDSPTRS